MSVHKNMLESVVNPHCAQQLRVMRQFFGTGMEMCVFSISGKGKPEQYV